MATASTTAHHPGPGNVYIPGSGNPGATGQLQVEFSRNPDRFAFNQYVQVVPVAKDSGYYPVLNSMDAVRLVNEEDNLWPDGDDAPVGRTRRHLWQKWTCERSAYPFTLGNRTVELSDWDVVAAHARTSATLAMTARTYSGVQVMLTAGNWPSANKSATIDALLSDSGNSWTSSSTSQKYIEKSFHAVVEAILKATGGAVRPGDICCVIGPDIAHAMRETAELGAYIVNHESTIPAWEQTGIFNAYGIPPIMFGVHMVVEDAVYAGNREGYSSDTGSFMMGNEAVFCSRPGGLVGAEVSGNNAAPSFSTITCFVSEDFTAETETDSWNRKTKGRVVDNRDIVLSATASGYHINDVTT